MGGRKIVESDFVDFFLTVRCADLELLASFCKCQDRSAGKDLRDGAVVPFEWVWML